MRLRWILAPVALLLGLLTLPPPGAVFAEPQSPPAAAKRKPRQDHPRISAPSGDCLRCHARMHSQIAADWEASKHGSRNVPCVSCHGAVGANFVMKPGATQCVSCHAAMVDSMKLPAMSSAAAKGEQACWQCHSPHRLNPHAALFRNEAQEEKAP
ncbi:MAG: cytochrome c3 family protein [Bryobacterales bacterium]|jgi:hypothetical protein|nr:cytochrome c3 family protein [Bryobacterales bacterium]